MNFSLEGPGAAVGGGIANAIKAYALGDTYRQKAEMDARLRTSQAYAQQMAGNKYGAEAALIAERLGLVRDPVRTAMIENQVPLQNRQFLERFMETGSQGPQFDPLPADVHGPVAPAPIPQEKLDLITRAIGLANRTNMTGSKVDDMAKAGDIEQTMRDRAAIQGGAAALPTAQAYFATSGKAPFDNVTDTGYTLNQVTGAITEQNPALAKLFGDKRTSEVRENNAQAANASASAGLTNDKRTHLRDNGSLPGTTPTGSRGDPAFDRAIDDARAEYALRYPVDMTGMRPKDAPEFDVFMDGWLKKRGIDPAKYFAGANKSAPTAGNEQKIQLPPGYTPEKARTEAKAAIAKGKDRAKVLERLQQMGVSTEGL